jgi:hypothetical protein
MNKLLIFTLLLSLIMGATVSFAGDSFTLSGNKFYFPDGTFFTTAPKDGKSLLNGNGAPTVVGSTGDFYIDTANNRLYGPYAGAWGSGVSLVGPQGGAGGTGNDGLNSLVLLTEESPGGICTNGGFKIQVGLDRNRNDILELPEISLTKYYCIPSAINTALAGSYSGSGVITTGGTGTVFLFSYAITLDGVLSGTLTDIQDNNRVYPLVGTVNMITGNLYIVTGMYDGSVVAISGSPTSGVWGASVSPKSNGGSGTYSVLKQ